MMGANRSFRALSHWKSWYTEFLSHMRPSLTHPPREPDVRLPVCDVRSDVVPVMRTSGDSQAGGNFDPQAEFAGDER